MMITQVWERRAISVSSSHERLCCGRRPAGATWRRRRSAAAAPALASCARARSRLPSPALHRRPAPPRPSRCCMRWPNRTRHVERCSGAVIEVVSLSERRSRSCSLARVKACSSSSYARSSASRSRCPCRPLQLQNRNISSIAHHKSFLGGLQRDLARLLF
jgi:hypothetical protein